MADITKFLFFLCFMTTFMYVPALSLSLSPENVLFLQPGLYRINTNHGDLKIFCFRGRDKHIIRLWETVRLKIEFNSEHYEMYDGSTPEEVFEQYKLQHSSWIISPFSWKSKNINLAVFNQSCIGILNQGPNLTYEVELIVIRIDFWRVLILCLGILLFISASRLSNTPVFYYLCGITLGICAGFLVVVYYFSKLLPKRPMMYTALIGGWTVGVYAMQMLWENFRTVLQQYQTYVLYYTAFTGSVSFVLCHRFGPVTDPRTKDLLKWILQIIGLGMVLKCSQYLEAALAVGLVIIAAYNFPSLWIRKAHVYWKRRFPPKMKLLTEDQYYEQGVRETQKALSELRGYCSSPDCDAWKTMLKLREPIRFAQFMSGNSHLSDEEMLEYETESRRCTRYRYDDSEEDEEDEEDELY